MLAPRMEKNAWKVAEEVAARIGDAPVHSEYIEKYFVANKIDDGLSFNQEYFSRSGEKRMAVPGAAYLTKIFNLLLKVNN